MFWTRVREVAHALLSDISLGVRSVTGYTLLPPGVRPMSELYKIQVNVLKE